ncbi:MAG: Ig-like domain-containing protein [Paludibacteraceae bacterium]|nr:Ig-like domain-containing protein [Paludibacteraceae bacterium]
MKKHVLIIVGLINAMAICSANFIKVTDASVLKDGDRVLLGRAADGQVNGGFTENKKALRSCNNAVFAGNTLSIDDATSLLLKKNGSYWNIYVGSTPIGHNSGNSHFDVTQATTSNFTIEIMDGGEAKITSQTAGDKNEEVFFNYNVSDPRFALYRVASNQAPIELYVLDGESDPVEIPLSVSLDKVTAEIHMGTPEMLIATVSPADAPNKSLTWGSTNNAVATVSNGIVTPVALGTTKIWVRLNAATDKTDTCEVTVLPATTTEIVSYNAVRREEYLPVGAKVFFGTSRNNENYVMGQHTQGYNYIFGTAANYGEERHSVEACLQYSYTIQREGNYYIFADHDGKYLRAVSEDKLGVGTQVDMSAKWLLESLNENDGTAILVNAGCHNYLYNNSNNDIFNLYSGMGDGSNIAKVILYSSEAPDWSTPLRDAWIEVDTNLLDWGKQEMDTTSHTWSGSRTLTVRVNDLMENAIVTLVADHTFRCDWTKIEADRSTPAEITVYWDAEQEGIYTGQLHITCSGMDEVRINLRAEAFDQTFVPEPEPEFVIDPDTLLIELNAENAYSTQQFFSFSATHLKRSLFAKWEHSEDTAYDDLNENKYMKVMAALQTFDLGYAISYEPGKDYLDTKVIVIVNNLEEEGTYNTKLHFYSLKENSKTAYEFYHTVNIIIRVSKPVEVPIDGGNEEKDKEAIEDTMCGVHASKIMREGRVLILRGESTYNVLGTRVK